MKFFYTFLLFLTTSYSLHAMNEPLSNIEEALVFRAINVHGLSAVSKHIENSTQNDTFIEKDFLYIKDIFHKNLKEKDALTTAIFNKITKIESRNEYRPYPVTILYAKRHTHMPATNYLGSYTQYYWGESNNFVRVESHITNKDTLIEIINWEKDRLKAAIQGDEQ